MSDVSTPPEVRLDDVVQRYVALRDKKSELEGEHKKRVAVLDEAMQRLEAFILKRLQTLGVESVRTEHGTAYTTTKTSAKVADWDMVLNFIREGDHWPMLEKRVSKTFVEAYQAEHNDIPPGIDLYRETAVNIRRS